MRVRVPPPARSPNGWNWQTRRTQNAFRLRGSGFESRLGYVIHAIVKRDLDDRETKGIATYGTPLTPFNGRDSLWDAYEEALDLACYLRQAIHERDNPEGAQ